MIPAFLDEDDIAVVLGVVKAAGWAVGRDELLDEFPDGGVCVMVVGELVEGFGWSGERPLRSTHIRYRESRVFRMADRGEMRQCDRKGEREGVSLACSVRCGQDSFE